MKWVGCDHSDASTQVPEFEVLMGTSRIQSITVLLVAATPEQGTPTRGTPSEIDAAREMRDIQEVLSNTPTSINIQVRSLPAATWERLHNALLDWRPHIVHIIAHGLADELELENDDRLPYRVSASRLAALLKTFRDSLRFILYSACNSKNLAKVSSQHANLNAIGFEGFVTPDDTRNFSVALYRNLLMDEKVAAAFSRACAVALYAKPVFVSIGDSKPENLTSLVRSWLPYPTLVESSPRRIARISMAFIVGLIIIAGSVTLFISSRHSGAYEKPERVFQFLVKQQQVDGSNVPYLTSLKPDVEKPAEAELIRRTPQLHGSLFTLSVAKVDEMLDEIVIRFPRPECSPSRVTLHYATMLSGKNVPMKIVIPSCERQRSSCRVPAGQAESKSSGKEIHVETSFRLDCEPIRCKVFQDYCSWANCRRDRLDDTSQLCSLPRDLWPGNRPMRVGITTQPALADEFCAWQGGRLPTEDEWDYTYATAAHESHSAYFASANASKREEAVSWDQILPWIEWVHSSEREDLSTSIFSWRQEFAGAEPGEFPTMGRAKSIVYNDFSTWRCYYAPRGQ